MNPNSEPQPGQAPSESVQTAQTGFEKFKEVQEGNFDLSKFVDISKFENLNPEKLADAIQKVNRYIKGKVSSLDGDPLPLDAVAPALESVQMEASQANSKIVLQVAAGEPVDQQKATDAFVLSELVTGIQLKPGTFEDAIAEGREKYKRYVRQAESFDKDTKDILERYKIRQKSGDSESNRVKLDKISAELKAASQTTQEQQPTMPTPPGGQNTPA